MRLVELTPQDVPDLMDLKASANWNQIEADWLRCMRLEPTGCVGFRDNSRIVASAMTINYGADLSWIGMVLTLPEYRGQGLARRLMKVVLARSTGDRVGLDASDMGKPLYESLGFVDECPIERWVRQPEPAAPRSLPPWNVNIDLDREIFGADRSALLSELAGFETAQCNEGYAFARPGSNFSYLGPWVASDARDARALLEWFLGQHGRQVTAIDLFPDHEHASALAAEFGFAPARSLTRMVLSPSAPRLPDQRVYGIAGFEFG
jgi:GNAT superfamily N-acetyltransferase